MSESGGARRGAIVACVCAALLLIGIVSWSAGTSPLTEMGLEEDRAGDDVVSQDAAVVAKRPVAERLIAERAPSRRHAATSGGRGALTVAVVDDKGRPMRGVLVDLIGLEEKKTSKSGVARFVLRPGEYRIKLGLPTEVLGEYAVVAPFVRTLTLEGDALRHEWRVMRRGQVDFRFDASVSAGEGVSVILKSIPDERYPDVGYPLYLCTVRGPAWRVTRAVPPGRWLVKSDFESESGRRSGGSREIVVRPGSKQVVHLASKVHDGWYRGVVEDERSRGVPNFPVVVSGLEVKGDPKSRREFRVRTDATGRFEVHVGALPSVAIRPQCAEYDRKRYIHPGPGVTARPGGENRIVLSTAYVVEGQLSGCDPKLYGTVMLRGSSSAHLAVPVDAGGRFRFETVPAGTFRAFVMPKASGGRAVVLKDPVVVGGGSARVTESAIGPVVKITLRLDAQEQRK